MKKVVLFGASGDIGKEIQKAFEGNVVITPSRKEVDFLDKDCYNKVSNLLAKEQPDIVINSVGWFGDNYDTHYNIMDVNFGSNWAIVRHYMLNPSDKPVKICMIGSICYSEGKDKYIVYAASKMAMYSLWQGASKYFKDTNVNIDLINPQRTKTRMTMKRIDENLQYHEPEEVAEVVYDFVMNKKGNNSIDTEFKI